jgi:hypothetical protein
MAWNIEVVGGCAVVRMSLDAHLPASMSDEGNRRAQDRRRQKIMRKR